MAVDFADRADLCQVSGLQSDMGSVYRACRLVLVDSDFSTAGPSDNKSLSSVKLSKRSAFKGNSSGSVVCHIAKILLIKFAQWYISKKLWYIL